MKIAEDGRYLEPRGIEAEVMVARRCLDLASSRTHEEWRVFGMSMWRILKRHPTTIGIRTEGRKEFSLSYEESWSIFVDLYRIC